jgi:hypothetical protein
MLKTRRNQHHATHQAKTLPDTNALGAAIRALLSIK